ncbi:hypothetical protein BCR42DRAFT_429009 [Absidia repens]|uniref:Mid2 domain-containing protein n=1 Tax=Absidia repens TaxID=90262 RepID=A0A1X2HXC5_9FUNG|nr:hypothetical protein BCR42DRAFT_429009 [Absidia repens]
MNQPLYKIRSLYIAPLVIFTIFDLTPFFFCFGQHLQTKTLINDSQSDAPRLVSSSSSRKAVNSNDKDPEALQQLHKLYILTLTSDYVVTQTATSYSYSSSTTTIIPSSSSTTSPGHSNESTPPSSTSFAPNDTAVLVGALVGGLCGLVLIGIGLFLIFGRRRNSKTDLPMASSSSFYIDNDGDDGLNSKSHVRRAFVPPLSSDPALSTPAISIEASSSSSQQQQQQHHQLHGHPYNTSDALIHAYYQQQHQHDTDLDRHVPDENDQAAVSERHVPHLVD